MNNKQLHTLGRAMLLGVLFIFGALVVQARQGNQNSELLLPVVFDETRTGDPDVPVARNDTYVAMAGETLVINAAAGVLANDIGPTGQTLTAVLESDTAHGTLALRPDGSFTYTAGAGYAGQDAFTYRAVAGDETSTPARVTITVKADNQPPVAAPDAYQVERDTELVIDATSGVLANDTDPDGDALHATRGTNVANGTLTLSADGSFVYIPAPGFTGEDSFTYTASDGIATSAPATVTITVKDSNQPPVAAPDAYQTDQDSELTVDAANGVLANDSDPDGDTLHATLTTDVANGALTLNADGSFVYTPAPGFAGEDSFTYTASDGIATSAPATVTITVIAGPTVNTPPRFVSGTPAFTHTVIGRGVMGTHIALGADLDNDGDMDIVATDYGNGRMLWYENDGQGNFTEHLLDDLEGAYPAAVGDVDLDGDDDVLAAGYLADTFVWYRNDGGGNFTRIDIDTDSDGAHSIIPVDLDGDGDIDLVTSSQDAGTIAWYENDGANNFTRHIVDDNTPDAKRAEVGDIDGDGDLDIVTAGYKNDEIAWLENDGNQNFTKHVIYNQADGVYYAYAADLNGDGHMDVISASKLDGTIAWYENDGNQNFTYRPLSTTSTGARTAIAVDLDGDGDMDVLSASLNDHTVAWFENDGKGNFTKRIVSDNVRGAYGVYAVDMDFDGDLDVLSAARNSNQVALHTAYRAHTVRISKGNTLAIDATRLRAIDDNDGPAELTYTLTAAPTKGELRLSGAALGVGGTFTQADVDAGRLVYAHTANNTTADRFDFELADGGEDGVRPATGQFTIEFRAGP